MEVYKWDPWWEDVLPFDNPRKAGRNDKANALDDREISVVVH